MLPTASWRMRAIRVKPSGDTIIRPSGSIALGSKPDATITSSGRKRSSAGTTTCSNVATYAPSPEPGGSGTLRL